MQSQAPALVTSAKQQGCKLFCSLFTLLLAGFDQDFLLDLKNLIGVFFCVVHFPLLVN